MGDTGSPADAAAGGALDGGLADDSADVASGNAAEAAVHDAAGIPPGSGAEDASEEASGSGAGEHEAGVEDATVDVGVPGADAGEPDASVHDAAVADTEGTDSATDARSADAAADATTDVMTPEGSAMDVGAEDAPASAGDATVDAQDASADAGPFDSAGSGGLLPCTTVTQTQCVQCQGNANNVCSPTEALFVQRDIDRGTVTTAGPEPFDVSSSGPGDPHNGCYACLYNQGCIDDTMFPDTGHECGDLSGDFTAGDGFSGDASATCLALVSCVVSTECANVAGGIDNCYCGPAGGSPSACPTNGPATNGPCKTEETNGLLAMPNDATTVLNSYTNLSQPAGLANQIFVCGLANGCTQCLE